MSKRIDRLKQTLKNNIAAGEAGFQEAIPSIRDLMTLLGESRHVVNTALKELEDEKVLLCKPQKGFTINPVIKAGDISSMTGIIESIDIVITEKLRWQTEHWIGMIRNFEKIHPQFKVVPHFISNTKKVSEFLDSRKGKPVLVVRIPPELLTSDEQFIPIPEIERILGEPLAPFDKLMPGLDEFMSQNAVPYILQPQMLLIRKDQDINTPNLDSWRQLFKWCGEVFGQNSMLPVNTELLLQRTGLWIQPSPNKAQLYSHLKEITELMRHVQEKDLYFIDLEHSSPVTQARKILDNPLRVLIRNSFYYGAVADSCKDNNIELYPLPLDETGLIDTPVCKISMIGTFCSKGIAQLFQYILGKDNQSEILRNFLGISPFQCWNQLVLKNPTGYPANLDMIITQLLETPSKQLLYDKHENTELQEYIICQVTDKLILPLLSGELTSDNKEKRVIEQICNVIIEKEKEINRENYVKSLRRQLLG